MNTHFKSVIKLFIAVIILSLSWETSWAQGMSSLRDQTQVIRIKKIANNWQGATLTFHTREGDIFTGQLLEVSMDNYILGIERTTRKVPLADVIKITYEPGTSELLLSVGSAFMGSAFLTGAILIAEDEPSDTNIRSAAFIGLLLGGFWGHSVFYESEVIYAE